MTVRKWAILGIVALGLACVAMGKPEIGGTAVVGLVGFLKSDDDDTPKSTK